MKVNGYDSKHEAEVARNLHLLAEHGKITELEEQKKFILVPHDGKGRNVTYWADFVYRDEHGVQHVLDAKGFKTDIYKLKKRLMWLLLHIEIEEV